MNWTDFLNDNNVHIAGIGERHYRDGWIAIECPFCSGRSKGHHLGISDKGGISCFRCGKHSAYELIAAVSGCDESEAWTVYKQYSDVLFERAPIRQFVTTPKSTKMNLPGELEMPDQHRLYLENRGYPDDKDVTPYQLADRYNLRFTVDDPDYPNRIIIPVTYNNRVVSFTSRDVTNNPLRYKTATKDNELRDIKHCVFGLDLVVGDTAIIVEGPFDCMSLGADVSCAVMGIKYTDEQVKLIGRRFTSVYILFDPSEQQAREQARNLSKALSAYCSASIVTLDTDKDAGDFTLAETNEVRTSLGFGVKQDP